MSPSKLPVAVRMAPMQGKMVPALCCAETGRVLRGLVSVDVSVAAQETSGSVALLRVSCELLVAAENCEGAT